MTSALGKVRFGTSSWSEKSWVGAFYPAGTKPANFLPHYATQFDTVEADTTYYAIPKREVVRGWGAKTPDGFVMAAKFPASIVHAGEGKRPDVERVIRWEHVGSDALRFLDVMRELGPKCGPLVLQFPRFQKAEFASLGAFLERLEPFLDALPTGFRYAVEVRNDVWLQALLFNALRRRNVALVLVDIVRMAHPDELAVDDLVTADFAYVRLIGDRYAIEARTDRFDRIVVDQGERLARWARTIERVRKKVAETFAYANNHYAGFAPETIRELARQLDERGSGGQGAHAPGS
ncbi:MAG: DUF72 domain-containing protein [Planctomycetota bacterium]